MNGTFKILGLLLTYPEGTILNAGDDLLQQLAEEKLLSKKSIAGITKFLHNQQHRDLMQVQEEYVATFDRKRAFCLHLFEHIHGESRDRGQAMVNLSQTYAEKGLYIDSGELPDYLPLFMEYLSTCDLDEAQELLGEAIVVITALGARLEKIESPYAAVLQAITQLSSVKADKASIKAEASELGQPSLDEIDRQWQEPPAFGNGVQSCQNGKQSEDIAVTGGVI